MEDFSKVLRRNQMTMVHWKFRIELERRYTLAFGKFRADKLMRFNRIEFDTQVEPHLVGLLIKKFKKRDGMPLMEQISLS